MASMVAMVLVSMSVMMDDSPLHIRVFDMTHHHPSRWWCVITHYLGVVAVMVR